MVEAKRISADWRCPVVVAATGPSLTEEVAGRVRRARWPEEKVRVIAVNDAYRRLQYADILYACDERWWRAHIDSVRAMFHGERWTTHEPGEHSGNRKDQMPADWGINCVLGKEAAGFSRDPSVVHYGQNSGFQAINLAILKGATSIILVGFDMGGRGHFFGDHPQPLHNRTDYNAFLPMFRAAAPTCPVPVLNATPGSAIDCWPMVTLEEALADDRLRRDWSEPQARTA